MLTAVERVGSELALDKIDWADDVSRTAHLQDAEEDRRLVRKIRLAGRGHDRRAWFFYGWRPLWVFCEQREGEDVRVHFEWR
jgi:hypothetical protein